MVCVPVFHTTSPHPKHGATSHHTLCTQERIKYKYAMRAFISYSHHDEDHVDRLRAHLAMLEREGLVEGWHDRRILAGSDLDATIDNELASCDLFFAMVSADFLASNYCYEREMQEALRRHETGSMRVVPILLEPCDWQTSPLGKLLALPTDAVAVSEWTNRENAYFSIAQEVRKIAQSGIETQTSEEKPNKTIDRFAKDHTLNTKYKIKKQFDEIDKFKFCKSAFDHIRAYFASSVEEINNIDGIKALIDEKSDDKFSVTLVNSMISSGKGYIIVRRHDGGHFGDIDFSTSPSSREGSSEGGFAVQHDDYEQFLTPQLFWTSGSDERISAKQAARMLWDKLLEQAGVSHA